MHSIVNTSLIISTYNWPKALDFCLQSVLQQTHLPLEILVADDGSGVETATLIQRYQDWSPIPIIHVWQEDNGFQLARIRNKAIAIAKGDYIIQIDGDLILDKHFICDHLRLAKAGFITAGSRAALDEHISKKILADDQIPSTHFLRRYCTYKLNCIRFSSLSFILKDRFKTRGRNLYYIKGCNMAYWKRDILQVNGYNETITGWGREDNELLVRLMKLGIRKQSLKMGGVAFHIWHRDASREKKEINRNILIDTIRQLSHRCILGINQYL